MPSVTAVDDERELLKRLIIAHGDLQLALSAIIFLGEEVDEHARYSKVELRRFKCFETTFVVAYGRAFTNSNGRYSQVPPQTDRTKANASRASAPRPCH